jgi:hypothetical protein
MVIPTIFQPFLKEGKILDRSGDNDRAKDLEATACIARCPVCIRQYWRNNKLKKSDFSIIDPSFRQKKQFLGSGLSAVPNGCAREASSSTVSCERGADITADYTFQ